MAHHWQLLFVVILKKLGHVHLIGKKLTDIDASIITDHMMMEATDLGLGSVWVCYFKPSVLKTEFNLPSNLEPVNILAIRLC